MLGEFAKRGEACVEALMRSARDVGAAYVVVASENTVPFKRGEIIFAAQNGVIELDRASSVYLRGAVNVPLLDWLAPMYFRLERARAQYLPCTLLGAAGFLAYSANVLAADEIGAQLLKATERYNMSVAQVEQILLHALPASEPPFNTANQLADYRDGQPLSHELLEQYARAPELRYLTQLERALRLNWRQFKRAQES